MYNAAKTECKSSWWNYIHVFLIKENELLKNYNETWDKVSNSVEKGFHSDPVYNEKYLKTKIKPYEGKINAGFYNYGMAEEGYYRVFLSVTLIDFVFKMAKNYCPHVHM